MCELSMYFGLLKPLIIDRSVSGYRQNSKQASCITLPSISLFLLSYPNPDVVP